MENLGTFMDREERFWEGLIIKGNREKPLPFFQKKYRGPDCEASDRVLVFKKELIVIVDISSISSLIRVRHRSLRVRHVYLRVRH